MNPADRVTFVVETAKAVLDGSLAVDRAAAAVELQAEQLTPLLRADRDSVTRSECESVATTLRMLAEQINDRGRRARVEDAAAEPAGRAGAEPDDDAYEVMARAIGSMAQALR